MNEHKPTAKFEKITNRRISRLPQFDKNRPITMKVTAEVKA